jgi:hypothetical protein
LHGCTTPSSAGLMEVTSSNAGGASALLIFKRKKKEKGASHVACHLSLFYPRRAAAGDSVIALKPQPGQERSNRGWQIHRLSVMKSKPQQQGTSATTHSPAAGWLHAVQAAGRREQNTKKHETETTGSRQPAARSKPPSPPHSTPHNSPNETDLRFETPKQRPQQPRATSHEPRAAYRRGACAIHQPPAMAGRAGGAPLGLSPRRVPGAPKCREGGASRWRYPGDSTGLMALILWRLKLGLCLYYLLCIQPPPGFEADLIRHTRFAT